MKKLLIIPLLFFSLFSYSQVERNIYSGGMLIFQPGYTITDNNHQKIESFGRGIGGILRFYFYDYFTAGIFGGTQKSTYISENSENSYVSIGYGGPFIGVSHKINKVRLTASAFVGRGSIKNLHIQSQSANILVESYYYDYGAVLFSPILSMDLEMSPRFLITFQTVCLISEYGNNKKLINPIFQIGILFNR